jgi:hypothetical protein
MMEAVSSSEMLDYLQDYMVQHPRRHPSSCHHKNVKSYRGDCFYLSGSWKVTVHTLKALVYLLPFTGTVSTSDYTAQNPEKMEKMFF